jgi:hypothetical protein
MYIYWFMLLLPALAGLFSLGSDNNKKKSYGLNFIVIAIFSVIIGCRYEIGGDWMRYADHFNEVSQLNFLGAILYGDPAYYGLNWIVARLGGDIHAVNYICGLILLTGTLAFSQKQPMPWLAIFVSVPYMLIAVGMGYSRQSAALGLALFGFTALGEGSIRKYFLYIFVAALFHKSAALLMPLAALTVTRNRAWVALWVILGLVVAYFALIKNSSGSLWRNYVEDVMESQGAGIRAAMNIVPAVVYLIFFRRWTINAREKKFWAWLSLMSVVCIALVRVAPAAVDRMGLYLIPLQLFVFSRVHRLIVNMHARSLVVFLIVLYYSVVLAVWLNFSSHIEYFVPYRATFWR